MHWERDICYKWRPEFISFLTDQIWIQGNGKEKKYIKRQLKLHRKFSFFSNADYFMKQSIMPNHNNIRSGSGWKATSLSKRIFSAIYQLKFSNFQNGNEQKELYAYNRHSLVFHPQPYVFVGLYGSKSNETNKNAIWTVEHHLLGSKKKHFLTFLSNQTFNCKQ